MHPHLFTPLPLRPFTLKNRLVMGSMHTGLEERHDWPALTRFYARRAQGGAALIITGGISANAEGAVFQGAAELTEENLPHHQNLTAAVHQAGSRIVLQILHAGRYAFSPACVAPSALKSPISPFAPTELTEETIAKQIADIAATAARAIRAGYDGIELMGSEGYLINQFLAPKTNRRTDRWGLDRRLFAREVTSATRAAIGDALLIFRISLIDLVEGGQTWEDTAALARELSPLVDIFNSGIGWHEARVPTIGQMVPRAAFAPLTARLRALTDTPVIAVNRIPDPQTAEAILASGQADLIGLARPLLADPDWPNKALKGQRITPCIACNQACLDHTFEGKAATCLTNPAAGREAEFAPLPATPRRIAVVGAGAAGIACALTAARRGHLVTLFEALGQIGGQMRLAAKIPGKEEFLTLLAFYEAELSHPNITLKLNTKATEAELSGFDETVIATGVRPRKSALPGPDYAQALNGAALGPRVAIIGAGGIGFDVAAFLLGHEDFAKEWGLGDPATTPGGLTAPEPKAPAREIWLLQRSKGKPGRGLGKTTGWIHRAHLAAHGVRMLGGVEYLHFDAQGLHILRDGLPEIIPATDLVICAGQEPVAELMGQRIGGARDAAGIDAKRAIEEGTRLGLQL
ncbi:FAD-dependent oxidoreductase [Stagnihabitans tardus]|uniref:FAD-dependent oxidoreductase n=1 Tax=Stagnihabitans tardus TaxID=2699202 RepID=A0AAE5BVR1_9RHOB|nr:FAD-dependent oxidoreductase [Stagnihabitans tardus]NBZ88492.1 FAD-dependent oxidoreductase [Stagnihabitans tardus]